MFTTKILKSQLGKRSITKFPQFKEKYDDIYLIRNERSVKIYDPEGRAFEPDFLLFVKQKEGEQVTYQIFIEPKGSGYVPLDKWKQDFLEKLRVNKQTIEFNTDHYLITGLPFYTNKVENDFKKEMDNLLNL